MDIKKSLEGKTEALLTFKNGESGYTLIESCEDGTFAVRYESGWWVGYKNNGEREHPPMGDPHRRDIVKIDLCEFKEGMNWGFRP